MHTVKQLGTAWWDLNSGLSYPMRKALLTRLQGPWFFQAGWKIDISIHPLFYECSPRGKMAISVPFYHCP